ncbi:MAG: winged helix DNA-binding domain-containing protein [bacterium]
MTRMDPRNVPSLRLAAQGIANAPRGTTPTQAVARLAALQGQDIQSSLWAIGLRAPASTLAAVKAEVAARRIVRSWAQRGTLHWVAAADLRWMLALTAPRMLQEAAGRERRMGLTKETVDRARKLLVKALTKGVQTREHLMLHLDEAGISTRDLRGYHMLWRLAHEGLICCAAPQGKEPTFALLEAWVPPTKTWTQEESLAEQALRYFTARGPCNLEDYVRWSGLTLKQARIGLALAKPQLAVDQIRGVPVWLARAATPKAKTPELFLLPAYDEYLLGYRYRDAVLAPEYAVKICPGGNGIFRPMIVFQGRIIGTWKAALQKGRIEVSPSPFQAWPKAVEGAFIRAAEGYVKFQGSGKNAVQIQ